MNGGAGEPGCGAGEPGCDDAGTSGGDVGDESDGRAGVEVGEDGDDDNDVVDITGRSVGVAAGSSGRSSEHPASSSAVTSVAVVTGACVGRRRRIGGSLPRPRPLTPAARPNRTSNCSRTALGSLSDRLPNAQGLRPRDSDGIVSSRRGARRRRNVRIPAPSEGV